MGATREQILKLTETIPTYKWKVQTANAKTAQCVAYIDARDMQRKLDECVGPENWQTQFQIIEGNLYGGIGILCDRGSQPAEWVWKWDCGTESMTEKEKGQASDAQKRAAVAWGVGRFLYDMDIQTVPTKEYNSKPKPCDDKGNIFWNNDDLTAYINKKIGKKSSSATTTTTTTQTTVKEDKKSDKYSEGGKPIDYSTSSPSPEVMARVAGLNRDGASGKQVLLNYIPKYNIANKTDYVAKDFTGDLLVSLLDFIDNTPPVGM